MEFQNLEMLPTNRTEKVTDPKLESDPEMPESLKNTILKAKRAKLAFIENLNLDQKIKQEVYLIQSRKFKPKLCIELDPFEGSIVKKI